MQVTENFESLSPYELFQLSRYGNVLNNWNPDEEDSEDRRPTSEENYIYELENPLT